MSHLLCIRNLVSCLVAAVLVAALATLAAPRPVAAEHPAGEGEEHPTCDVRPLGELAPEPGVPLTATGGWTTEDCDSRFRAGSDAHTYGFELQEPGRVRIELRSPEADSFLYLMAEDGSRIEDDDDGAAALDARIERDLEPGSYLVEATTVGGRARSPANFSLSVVRLSCDPQDLGALLPGVDLTAAGTWTLDTCGSQIVSEHPAHTYTFVLSEAARVRIDLESERGDPVLSLASPERGVIGANDDGGGVVNARLEQYLPAGPYLIEATTYRQRDLQSLLADFTLTIHLVDEEAAQQRFLIKMEHVHAPEQVIVGEPFSVDYRVGNVGAGDLPEDADVIVYAVGPGIRDAIRGRPASLFHGGAAYHSSPQAASATSLYTPGFGPFSLAWRWPGPSWVFVAVLAFDSDDEEIAFHGIWRNVRVVSGPTFGPVTVTVEGAAYEVTAAADDEGVVETSVVSPADPGAEPAAGTAARATYAAAVRALVLDGLFERTALRSLPTTAEPARVSLPDASSTTLLGAFAGRYVGAMNAAGVVETFAGGEAVSPVAIEELTLDLAGTASAQYAHLAASWNALQGRIAEGGALSFAEARALRVELAYAERVLAPAIAAGEIVTAARGAEQGWDDPGVAARLAALAAQHSCDVRAPLGVLEAAGVEDTAVFVGLHRELHAALPAHALAVDAVLCGAAAVDGDNASFLERLDSSDPELQQLDVPDPGPPAETPPPAARSLRILARLAADGRVEHGLELAGGELLLPAQRFLPEDAALGAWHVSSEVEVAEGTLGQVRARQLPDGRIEWSFREAGGGEITPEVRFLPSDPPEGVWFRSTPFEVAPLDPAEE